VTNLLSAKFMNFFDNLDINSNQPFFLPFFSFFIKMMSKENHFTLFLFGKGEPAPSPFLVRPLSGHIEPQKC
jgi:hypothetical protein